MKDTAAGPASRHIRPNVVAPGLAACLGAIRAPAVYRNFIIHLVVMIPATVVMCWVALQLDAWWGWGWAIGPRLSQLAGGLSLGLGAVWVWYVYGYLYLTGGGSPGTHVDGGPARLVDTGPYTMIRHPSVQGKLAGVVGLGLLSQSPTFLVVFVPVLLVYSLITNRYLQERYCEARFGAAYAAYRRVVPMLIPRPSGVARWLKNQPALGADMASTTTEDPDQISPEFRWYLVGLVTLLAVCGLVWAAIGGA